MSITRKYIKDIFGLILSRCICRILSCTKCLLDIFKNFVLTYLFSLIMSLFVYLEELGYTYENHTVVTEDGYRLLLVRIPYNNNESPTNTTRPPVLFVHGLLTSFNDFLVAGPGMSFGFKAVEEGYDVFLLNTRGNKWSRSHTTLEPDLEANAFWNFSWHEVGIYDLSATIDYILNITEQSKLSYVGHSQGCSAFLALTSTKPDYNEKLNVAVLLAPVSYLANAKFVLIRLLKNRVRLVQALIEILQINEILPYTPVISNTGKTICSANSPLVPACEEIYKSVGPSGQINDSLLSAYIASYPAGASAKEALHFLQNAHSGEFRLYDYGKEDNLIQYGQAIPPDYNLAAITSPVALFYGAFDYFVALADVARLRVNLPNVIRDVQVSLVATNHLDVLIGTSAERLVTQPALNVLNQYNNL